MRRLLLPFVLLLLVLLTLIAAPVTAQPNDSDWIEPEAEGLLEPCCDNENNAFPPLEKRVGRALPDHSFFAPEELARRKAAAFASPDLPPGRRLKDKGGPSVKGLALRNQFEGLNFLQSGGFFPPDTIVAASSTRVLEATNVALRLTDRNGNGRQQRSLDDFFGLPTENGFHFDPKVHFDRLSNRFFLVDLYLDLVARESFVYLAVSRSSTPGDLSSSASWCTYRIDGKVGESWADYPGLGMNEKWLAISVNNFAFRGPFRSVFVYALDKQRLAANAGSCPSVGFSQFGVNQDGNGQIAFTVQPAQHYSTGDLPGSPLFLVSSDLTSRVTRDYTLWRVVERASGEPGLQRHGLQGAQRYTLPPNAAQSGIGAELDTGDTRIQQAAFGNGIVWAVHTTGCNFGFTPGESCVRVVGITPTDGGASITFEEIFGGGHGWFVWMPGVAVNSVGDLAVAFQRSRSNMSAGMAFAGKPSASASFERLSKLVNGRCRLEDNFDGERHRTGDYVGVQTDPLDDRGFWIAGEYTGGVGGQGCNWRTRVALISF